MLILAIILFLLATTLAWAGAIWLIVVAFRQSVGWGWACLLIPFAIFVFVAQFWAESAKPFLVSMCAMPLMAAATVMLIFSAPGIQNASVDPQSAGVQQAPGFAEAPQQNAPIDQLRNPFESRNPFDDRAESTSTQPKSNSSRIPSTNVSRGEAYRPPSPRSSLTMLRYESGDVVLSTLMGPRFGSEFGDAAPAGGILIGLGLSDDSQSSGGIGSVRPIYQVGSQCVYGDQFGQSGGQKHELVAKSGYAIAGLLLRTSTAIELIQVIFCKVKADGRLDVGDQYLSERIGRESGTKRRIFSEGRPIVEIFGSASTKVCGIGLGAVQPSSGVPTGELARDDAPATENKAREPLENEHPAVKAAAEVEKAKHSETAVAEPIRTWASAGGSFKVDAKLKSIDGSDAVLEQRDGKTLRVAIDKLSIPDQDYLKSRPKK